MVNLMIQLAPGAAEAAHLGHDASPDLGGVEDQLQALELALEPLHPGTGDRSLASWFRVVVDDAATADRLAAALRESPAVESAYVEPPSGPPQ